MGGCDTFGSSARGVSWAPPHLTHACKGRCRPSPGNPGGGAGCGPGRGRRTCPNAPVSHFSEPWQVRRPACLLPLASLQEEVGVSACRLLLSDPLLRLCLLLFAARELMSPSRGRHRTFFDSPGLCRWQTREPNSSHPPAARPKSPDCVLQPSSPLSPHAPPPLAASTSPYGRSHVSSSPAAATGRTPSPGQPYGRQGYASGDGCVAKQQEPQRPASSTKPLSTSSDSGATASQNSLPAGVDLDPPDDGKIGMIPGYSVSKLVGEGGFCQVSPCLLPLGLHLAIGDVGTGGRKEQRGRGGKDGECSGSGRRQRGAAC